MGGLLHCALHHTVSNDGLYIMCNAFWTAVVSVSTEPVYSHDQFAHSYLNPFKQYMSDLGWFEIQQKPWIKVCSLVIMIEEEEDS